MEVRDKIYIDGAWVSSTGKGTLEVFDSNTEEVIGTIPEGTADDVEKAVAAASAAFGEWSCVSHEERSKLLARASEGLAARTDEIAETISKEVGMPLYALQDRPGRPADRRVRRHGQARSPTSSGRPRSATRSSSGSRSGWSGRSRRGTTRSTRSH